MRFKVGDYVKVRAWKDMACEFFVDSRGDICCPNDFTSEMRKYCGKIFEIRYVGKSSGIYWLSELSGVPLFYTFNDDMLELTIAQRGDMLE